MHCPTLPKLALLCAHCGAASGSKLICDGCLREVLSDPKLRRKYDRLFQERGCLLAGYICSYCGGNFNTEKKRRYVCIDHIKPKGSNPKLRYDFTNGRCTCGAAGNDCHNKRGEGHLKADESTAENMARIAQRKSSPARPRCSYFSCNLSPVLDGRCVIHPKSRF